MIQGLSEYLGKSINIYHENGYITVISPVSHQSTGDPLQVGNIMEKHYVSLHKVPCNNTTTTTTASPVQSEILANDYFVKPEVDNISKLCLPKANLADGPCRPILSEYPVTRFGCRNRSFHASWYTDYSWLEYSIADDAVFCFYCRLFVDKVSNKKQTSAFVTGYRNWRDSPGTFAKHESTDQHKQTSSFYLDARQMLLNETSVACKISSQHANSVE